MRIPRRKLFFGIPAIVGAFLLGRKKDDKPPIVGTWKGKVHEAPVIARVKVTSKTSNECIINVFGFSNATEAAQAFGHLDSTPPWWGKVLGDSNIGKSHDLKYEDYRTFVQWHSIEPVPEELTRQAYDEKLVLEVFGGPRDPGTLQFNLNRIKIDSEGNFSARRFNIASGFVPNKPYPPKIVTPTALPEVA